MICKSRQIFPRPYERMPGKALRASLIVQSLGGLKVIPSASNSALKKLKSKFTLCATNTASLKMSAISSAICENDGAPANMWVCMPVSAVINGGREIPGLRSV